MIIGEALFKLENEHEAIAIRIPEFQKIIGMRHIVVHHYDRLNDSTVVGILQTKLEPLCSTLRELLKELGTDTP